MNEQDRELLSAYLDNALSQGERVDAEQRLAADPELRREMDSLQLTIQLIQSLPELTAPRSFALTKDQARRPARLLNFPTIASAASAVAAVALLLIGFSLLSTPQTAPVGQVAVLATNTMSEITTSTEGYSAAAPLPAASPQLASPTQRVDDPLILALPTATAIQPPIADMAFAATTSETLDDAASSSIQMGNTAQGLTSAADTASSAESAAIAAQPEMQSGGDANGVVAGFTDTIIPATPPPFPSAAPTQLTESTNTPSEVAAQATIATESRIAETDEAEMVNDGDVTVAGEETQTLTDDTITPTGTPAPADLARAAQTDQTWLGATLIIVGGILLVIAVVVWLSGRRR